MKSLKHFHLFFISLFCSLIVTGDVIASESAIMSNQSKHSFPATPSIKTVAFTQEHSEEKPLESLALYVIEK